MDDDNTGAVELLPGEFDYFLSMMGVTREAIMHGVRDMAAKARLEAAMDERRTGDDGYRRRYVELRDAVGSHRNPLPFGYSQTEAKALREAGAQKAGSKREALGISVRRATNGAGSEPPPRPPKLEQVQRAISRLTDEDLTELGRWLRKYEDSRTEP